MVYIIGCLGLIGIIVIFVDMITNKNPNNSDDYFSDY